MGLVPLIVVCCIVAEYLGYFVFEGNEKKRDKIIRVNIYASKTVLLK